MQDYRVISEGNEFVVHHTDVCSFVLVPHSRPMELEIIPSFPFCETLIRPLSKGIQPRLDGDSIRVRLDLPTKLSLELDGGLRRPLFIFADPPDPEKPELSDPKIKRFGPGIHNPGIIKLSEGETAYLDEGAVVYGVIEATGATGISIRGRGILCGSRLDRKTERYQMIKLTDCTDILIEGVTVLDGPNWHVVPIACTGVDMHGINVITLDGTGDGIDIVGCENVRISDCFVRSKDDCIAIKAVDYQEKAGCKDVRNVFVTKSVFWNAEWGNALEIGYETRCGGISGITFEDCDIIHCEFEGWQSGGTFTIHNGDRAVIRDILYRDIRVEDSREKLVDIKILHSNYSRDPERGHVGNIRFQDIRVVSGPFPVSVIRGFDADHLIGDISFDNLQVHGKRIMSANEARMVVELSKNISFS